MAAKTRAILLAVVLLSAGLAGCADTDDTDTDDRDTDTGDRDTRETDERDTRDEDTDTRDTDQRDGEEFNRTFQDTIDEQNYQRNWSVPANSSGANVTIEANLSGDAVDDFEATLFTPDGDEVCTVSHEGDTGTDTLQPEEDENECDEELEDTGEHRLTVWGNTTADEAEYWINVTVETPDQAEDDGTQTGGDGGGGIYNSPVSSVVRA